MASAAAARADEPRPLDGIWVTIGPVGAAARLDDAWLSAVGLELSVVKVTEKRFPAAIGLCGGGVSYSGRPGGRLWLEAEAATGAPFPVGIGAGIAMEVDRVRPFRPGAQATIWFLTGIVPYARVGTVVETGPFFEAGVMLKVPARRFP